MMFNMNDVSDVLKEVVKPEHALAIDSVNSYEDMARYYMTKNTEYVLARFEYKNEYLHILKEAEEAVKDYSSYKSKNIPATKDQSDMIESCHALSQLRVIALKLQLREITVGEIDFPKLKAIIPSSFICKKTLEYLRKTCDTLIACFLEARYLVLARVFVMIYSYCVANMRYRSSKIDFSQDNLALDKLIIEFNYAKTVLVLSYELDKYNIDISQEQLEDEQIFVKVLKTIGIDDFLSEVPYMLDSIEDAERFCNIFIPKLDRGATLCQKGPKSESKYETLIFIEYIRGLMPFVMAYYEKDFISRNEFVEQSYSQWNSVKEQYFSRDQLENQIQRLSANMILDFNTMMVNHLVNYDNLIAFKCDNIMDEEPMLVIPAIEDVNRLRSEYVTHMHDSLNFYRVGPSTCFDEHMKGNLYLYIAREFRNIVSKSWAGQTNNLKLSLKFLNKHYKSRVLSGHLKPGDSKDKFIQDLIKLNDETEFVRKFREGLLNN